MTPLPARSFLTLFTVLGTRIRCSPESRHSRKNVFFEDIWHNKRVLLLGKRTAMSLAPRFTITHAITAALTRIERARGFLDAAKLSEDWIGRMQKRALVLEAHHTTHIEGTQLTLEQSERILAGKKVQGASQLAG